MNAPSIPHQELWLRLMEDGAAAFIERRKPEDIAYLFGLTREGVMKLHGTSVTKGGDGSYEHAWVRINDPVLAVRGLRHAHRRVEYLVANHRRVARAIRELEHVRTLALLGTRASDNVENTLDTIKEQAAVGLGIHRAHTVDLEVLANVHGLVRNPGESDDSLRARLNARRITRFIPAKAAEFVIIDDPLKAPKR